MKKSKNHTHAPVDSKKAASKLLEHYFDEVGESFLRHSTPPDPAKVANWKPRLWSLNTFNPWYGGLMGVHRKRFGVGTDKIVWLEAGNANGPVLVLLHGFSAAKEHWLPLLPFFAATHRIIIPDLPGWGESGFDPLQPYGLDDQADRVVQWLKSTGMHKVNIVGNSMGGAISALIAARCPDMITSLTLMDALGVPGTEHTDFIHDVMRGRNRLVPRDAAGVLRLTDLVFYNRALAASAAFFSATELIHRRDVNMHLFREMVGRRIDFNRATFEDIKVPTLVMWGAEDEVLHISSAHAFVNLIKRSELCILKGVGHLPMLEAPLLCAQAIREFVRKSI